MALFNQYREPLINQDLTKLTGDALKLLEEKLAVVITGEVRVLQSQIDAYAASSKKFEDDLQRVPTAVQSEVAHLKEVLTSLVSALETLTIEKFKNVGDQFEQRDKALIAALQAAKEAVSENNKASADASTKSELNFSEAIKALQSLSTLSDTNTRERLGKLEAFFQAIQQQLLTQQTDKQQSLTTQQNTKTTDQAHTGLIIAAAAVIAAVASSAITLLFGLLNHVQTIPSGVIK